MPSLPEASLAHRDPAIPGLATLLDSSALQAALRHALPTLDVRSVRIDYLRYKPGTNCIAALTLDAAGIPKLAYAKALSLSELPRLVSRHNPASQHDSLLRSIATEFHLFPSDSKLPQLPRVSDPDWAAQRAPRPADDLPRSPVLTVEPLAYKPERRFVARWTLADGRRFVAKSYRPADFNAVRANAEFARTCHHLPLARLATLREHRATLVFHWTEGLSLAGSLSSPSLPSLSFEAVGETLAQLHQRPAPPHLAGRFPPDEAARLEALRRHLAFLSPESRPLLDHLVPALARAILLHPPSLQLCHGDFHAGQILLGSHGPHLLDLDELHLGDPTADLASFIAHLERETLRGRLSASRRDAITDAFLHGYSRTRGTAPAEDLPALVAARLLAETPGFFRTLTPDWASLTHAAIERPSDLARGHTLAIPSPSYPSQPPAVPVDPALPTLASALDPATATNLVLPILATHLQLAAPRITEIHLRRHKPGRRCLIEYTLATDAPPTRTVSVLAKLRRRGVDAANFAFLQELSRNGFGPTASDGISIPPPLAAIPSLGLVLHARVPGSPLTQRLSDPAAPRLAARTADALLKLHRSRHTVSRRHSVTDELDHLRIQLARTAVGQPALRQRILNVFDECARLAEQLAPSQPALLHRDFYPDQILVDGGRLWIVDLDLAAVGDPALDAGNFLAHVIEHALRVLGDPHALAHVEHAFRIRFLGRSGAAAESIHTWTTLALARHIALSTQIQGREHTTSDLLLLCEERLTLGLLAQPSLTF